MQAMAQGARKVMLASPTYKVRRLLHDSPMLMDLQLSSTHSSVKQIPTGPSTSSELLLSITCGRHADENSFEAFDEPWK